MRSTHSSYRKVEICISCTTHTNPPFFLYLQFKKTDNPPVSFTAGLPCQWLLSYDLSGAIWGEHKSHQQLWHIVFSLGCALRNLQMTEGRIELVVGSLQADANNGGESPLLLSSLHNVLSHCFPDWGCNGNISFTVQWWQKCPHVVVDIWQSQL